MLPSFFRPLPSLRISESGAPLPSPLAHGVAEEEQETE